MPRPSWRSTDTYLRRLRIDARLSIRAVADRAGCSPQHLGRIELGHRLPSDELLGALAGIYNLRPSELIDAIRRNRAA